MVHATQGIVLRCIRYGETSLICSVFTELLGLQSYMVKGVRSARARHKKAALLHPASLLDMIVYHQPQKNLQFIKEFGPGYLYQHLHEDVPKNGVAVFAMELTAIMLSARNPDTDLFYFVQAFLKNLDLAPSSAIANLPLYFMIQTGKLSGYHIAGRYGRETPYVDVFEGRFTHRAGHQPPFIEKEEAQLLSLLNEAVSPEEMSRITMTNEQRRMMLHYYLIFFQLHVPHFSNLKSVDILREILY